MECFWEAVCSLSHESSISFLSGIRDYRKAGSLWGMLRSVGGVMKSIYQSWLAKELGLGLGLLWWGFKGVQEVILSEEASTLQIESVAFPPGQCTRPQLHPCHRLFEQDSHLDSFSASLESRTLLPVAFAYFPKLRGCHHERSEEIKETVTKVIDMLTQEDFHGPLPEVAGTVQLVHYSRRRLLQGD